MKACLRLEVGIVLVTCLVSCVIRPVPPELAPEEVRRSQDRLAKLRVASLVEDRRRLLEIEYALATATAQRCGALARPHAGVLLTQAEAFEDAALRESLVEDFDPGQHTTVVYAVPGGPFDRAGIRPGDRLLEIDGKSLDSPAHFIETLHETNELSLVEIRLQRGTAQQDVTVGLDAACPVLTSVSLSQRLITHQPRRLHVSVPLGVIRLLPDVDTLAVAVAHEVAHALFDDPGDTWLVQEQHADRNGLLLAAEAGFDPAGALAYWERVAVEYPWLIAAPSSAKGSPASEEFAGYTHYGIGARLQAIRATVEELETQHTRIRARPGHRRIAGRFDVAPSRD